MTLTLKGREPDLTEVFSVTCNSLLTVAHHVLVYLVLPQIKSPLPSSENLYSTFLRLIDKIRAT